MRLRQIHQTPNGLVGIGPNGHVLGATVEPDQRRGQGICLRLQHGDHWVTLLLSDREAWWLLGRISRHLGDPPDDLSTPEDFDPANAADLAPVSGDHAEELESTHA